MLRIPRSVWGMSIRKRSRARTLIQSPRPRFLLFPVAFVEELGANRARGNPPDKITRLLKESRELGGDYGGQAALCGVPQNRGARTLLRERRRQIL